MLFLFELAKVALSVLVVGTFGVLSFFGFDPDVVRIEAEPAAEERVELKKAGGDEVGERPTLPTLGEDVFDVVPASTPPEPSAEGSGGGGSEVGSVPPVVVGLPSVEVVDEQIEEKQALPAPGQLPEEEVGPSFADINTVVRAALVNILCESKAGGALKPTSGSGVVIDPRGVVLTNAHVAQFFLLKDYPSKDSITCSIRTGSPARPAYRASLLYFPSTWVESNADEVTNPEPLGTGEHDYALLYVTGLSDPAPSRPSPFSSLPLDIDGDDISVGKEVLLAGYPAGFLSGAAIQRDLYAASATAEIVELFTFVADTLDLFSVSSSVVAQRGASGGAVVSKEGALLGIFVTSSDEESTADRELRAITLGHIERSLRAHTGFGLDVLLFGDLSLKMAAFNTVQVPILTETLVKELLK